MLSQEKSRKNIEILHLRQMQVASDYRYSGLNTIVTHAQSNTTTAYSIGNADALSLH